MKHPFACRHKFSDIENGDELFVYNYSEYTIEKCKVVSVEDTIEYGKPVRIICIEKYGPDKIKVYPNIYSIEVRLNFNECGKYGWYQYHLELYSDEYGANSGYTYYFETQKNNCDHRLMMRQLYRKYFVKPTKVDKTVNYLNEHREELLKKGWTLQINEYWDEPTSYSLLMKKDGVEYTLFFYILENGRITYKENGLIRAGTHLRYELFPELKVRNLTPSKFVSNIDKYMDEYII